MKVTKRLSKIVFAVFALGLLLSALRFTMFPAANSKSALILEQADAIFVFSGSAEYKARTRKAAELFHQKRAALIVLTNDTGKGGWSARDERNPFYWELAQRELIAQGVPAEAIEILPEPVFGTHDEAVLLYKIANERRWQAVLLVTSEFHAARALWTVERVFDQNNAGIAVAVESAAATSKTADAWTTSASETVKFWYYQSFY